MRITLTSKQIRELLPFYDRVLATAVAGNPGMLVAQIRKNQDGQWWMEPGFLDHEHAKLIEEKGQDVRRRCIGCGSTLELLRYLYVGHHDGPTIVTANLSCRPPLEPTPPATRLGPYCERCQETQLQRVRHPDSMTDSPP